MHEMNDLCFVLPFLKLTSTYHICLVIMPTKDNLALPSLPNESLSSSKRNRRKTVTGKSFSYFAKYLELMPTSESRRIC